MEISKIFETHNSIQLNSTQIHSETLTPLNAIECTLVCMYVNIYVCDNKLYGIFRRTAIANV